uniref:Uncharacterized protein n=1 Tax=Meloidogyne javanica TaxID=6303 RepID=A0A915MNJ1_MELJA
MCIIRYWLEKLFRCGYKEAEFDNIIFNPVLIKLLFENEVKELNTSQTTLVYCIAKFENEAMKFVKDHLKIFDKLSVEFTLCNNPEQCNGIILNILNEGARLPYKITTSTTCVSKIEFQVSHWDSVWNFDYLHNREGVETKQFIQYGQVMYSSSYEIANIDDPNIIFLIDKLAMKKSKSGLPQNSLLQVPDPNRPGQALKYKKIDIKLKSFVFSLNDDLKKKWELAVSERIPLFLSFNGSREAYILLDKLYPTNEEIAKGSCNLNLKLSLFPKNIEEMCIIRYWLDKLFRCGYDRAEFENIIFNPVLIKLLFENEVMELNTKQTTLHYPIAKFESEAMKFVKDHLKIFDKFSVEFTLYDEDSDFDGIIMDILNDGARFPH